VAAVFVDGSLYMLTGAQMQTLLGLLDHKHVDLKVVEHGKKSTLEFLQAREYIKIGAEDPSLPHVLPIRVTEKGIEELKEALAVAVLAGETSRPTVFKESIDRAEEIAHNALKRELEKKGYGGFVSSHEMLGVLEEEVDEFKREVQRKPNTPGRDESMKDELCDIIVTAMFGLACLEQGTTDW
jgi:hypothetical protein